MNKEIHELLKVKKYTVLKQELEQWNRVDIAFLIEEADREDAVVIFRLLEKDRAAEVFTYMEPDLQEKLIEALTDQELKEIICGLFLDDTVDLIEEMPSNVVKRILKHTDSTHRELINEFLNYPSDSAGSMMTIEFVDLRSDMTVEEAFARIRKIGPKRETIYTCYVLDPGRILIGIVTVKDLLLSEYDTKIGNIMEKNIIMVDTHMDQEEVVHMFDKYDFLAIPVVDGEKRLVGIITVDDAMEVMREENEEDFEIMAAMSPTEESYFKTSVWRHARNRILWLLFLMLSATITGTIITQYEDAFAAIPLLVAFIPMLMDTGGNCGSQSSTLIIRGLAMGEIKMKDLFRVVWKEARVAVLVGATLAVVNGVRISLQYHSVKMAVVVGLSLIATVFLSKMLGCCLPILAKKLHLDPAIMAAPLITTVVDTCSTLIYFNIAMYIMHL